MDKLDRKDLKHDHFVEEVQHLVDVAAINKGRVQLIGGIVLAALVLGFGGYLYRERLQTERQAALMEAVKIQEGVVVVPGNQAPPGVKGFPNEAAKNEAANKGFSTVALKYAGKDEGEIARYYLGVLAADKGKTDEAIKHFQQVAANSSKNYASLAKFSLSQLLAQQGKIADAEKLLKELEDSPTMMVSKEQAQIERALIIAKTKPEEARKILDPLRTSDRPLVSRSALSASAELGK